MEQQGKLDFESLKYMAETVEGDILKIDENGIVSRAEFEYLTASSHFGWYNSADYYPIHEELL